MNRRVIAGLNGPVLIFWLSVFALIGVPCPERGQKVKAFVVLADFAEPSDELAEKLQGFVKEQIAPYKYPRDIEFVDALPKTATGKLRRSELRGGDS